MRTESINHWDVVAENYSYNNHQGKNFHAQIYLAAVNELLGSVDGKHILDAGCGDGFFVRTCTKRSISYSCRQF